MGRIARRTILVLIVVALGPLVPVAADQDPPTVAATEKLSPAEEAKRLQLPPGFEIQLVASEPDIHKPMNMCFDDRGRLWLTDTVEYPYPVAAGKTGRDRVMILEDFGPDGRARKITTFAEGLNIPIGIHPYKDGCIVFSMPNIWFLRDTDGDGKADKKERLYGPFGTRDTHGMTNSFTIGFDGWLYACHGYLNDSVIKGTDGQELRMNSGNTYRMKLDGSHCEIFTRGQVNPFGLAWDPLGNLYSADCHSRPLTQLLRGAWYESFSKPHDGLGFAPHINEFGEEHSTGLCGIVYYAADQFPKEYRDKIFLGDVVRNRVNVYRLDYTGSTPKAVFGPFITSKDPWFRPVDLKLGPDGAIYLADFYNRIIGHYEVPLTHPGRDRTSGRIWRIVWKGTDGQAKPPQRPYHDLRKESPEKLVELLGHPNLTVRMQATNEMVARGDAAKEPAAAAMKSDSAACRIHALWTLERLAALDDGTIKRAMEDPDVGVKVHLARVLAERKEITEEQRSWLNDALRSPLRELLSRCAMDALGRHPDYASLKKLLLNAPSRADAQRVQVHRMAVRDCVKAGLLWGRSPESFALYEKELAEAINGAPSAEAASFLLRLSGPRLNNTDIEFIARNGGDDVLADLTQLARRYSLPRDQIERFRAVQRGIQVRGMKLPKAVAEWANTLVDELLSAPEPAAQEGGAELAGSLKMVSKQDRLMRIALSARHPDGPRAAALAALLALDAKNAATVGKIVTDADEPLGLRERAARALGALNARETRAELLKALPAAPATVASAIAFGLTGTPAGCEGLLRTVAEGKASPRLLQEAPIRVRLEQARLPNLGERLAKLTAGIPPADQRMNELLQKRRESFVAARIDAAAGAKVYEKSCAICHQIAGKGTKAGPQLDGIGTRGVERLLEDILDPNRNVDPNFRSTRLTLKDGKDLQGLVLREEGEVVVMADNQGKEIRVEKKTIEERVTSPLSAMPANLADSITADDFNHLLAYLLTQRGK